MYIYIYAYICIQLYMYVYINIYIYIDNIYISPPMAGPASVSHAENQP